MQQENKRLLEQNRNLQTELLQLRPGKKNVSTIVSTDDAITPLPKKKSSIAKVFLWILAGLFVAAIFVYAVELNYKKPV